ncbi:MAG: hypothetical protein ACK5MY_18785 [Jhaorihella sp.]
MFIGILALAMVLGGLAASLALIAGHSLLVALAVYSGCGTIGALAVALVLAAVPAARRRAGNDPAGADLAA